MKAIKLITLLFGLLSFTTKAQQLHPTISNFSVSYKPISQPTVNTNSFLAIRAIPQATIVLNQASTVSSIYFKILNSATNEIIYQINYPINSTTILSNSGKKLFENANGVIFISNGVDLDLKPYKYEIVTSDAQNNMSSVFSEIK